MLWLCGRYEEKFLGCGLIEKMMWASCDRIEIFFHLQLKCSCFVVTILFLKNFLEFDFKTKTNDKYRSKSRDLLLLVLLQNIAVIVRLYMYG